jgi:hypothetical protein
MLNVPHPPPVTTIPSVDPVDVASSTVIFQPVTVVTSHMEFLRVATNDPHQHFLRIRDLVDSFDFPELYRRLSFTLLRRLIIQRLVSKIRPQLAFQPLLHADADMLDVAMLVKP